MVHDSTLPKSSSLPFDSVAGEHIYYYPYSMSYIPLLFH